MADAGIRDLNTVELVLDRQSLLLLVVNVQHDTVDQYDLLKLHEVRTGPKVRHTETKGDSIDSKAAAADNTQ